MRLMPAKITVDRNIGGAVNAGMNGLVTVGKLCWQTGRLKVAFKIPMCQAGPEKQKSMSALRSAGSLRRASWGKSITPFLEVQNNDAIKKEFFQYHARLAPWS